jgi:hypothetical protein
MTDIVTVLPAASANGTGPVLDAGDLKSAVAIEVEITGTVSAFSVQLSGSLDDVNWFTIGSAVTSVTAGTLESAVLARYFKAALSGYTGTGTVTAKVAFQP